jgi:hypothetical protein
VSRSLSRPRVELLAFISWCVALAAVTLLVDSTAAFLAILGSGYCAGIVYWAARRQWWSASGLMAVSAWTLLNIVTRGDHSPIEHNVVFAAELIAFAYFLIATAADRRGSKRKGQPQL